MKKIIVLIALLFIGLVSNAQQDAQFTQYMYNTININPGYAGSKGALSVFVLHRTQWVGLDGAPVTNAVSINTPINESNLGLGISLVNDKIGPTSENAFSADLSYSIQTSEDWKMSFGLKATANLFSLDDTKLTPKQAADPSLQNYSKFSPNIGAGVYFHSSKAYVGLSIPNFIETNTYNDNDVKIYKEKMNYYLIAGYVFDLNDQVKFKPALLTKMVTGAPLQVDVSSNFMFFDKFTVGLAYRWSAALSGMVGFQLSDAIYVGYGYDKETTTLQHYNSGSHEIFLRYEIFKTNKKITSPRFF
jgi:type IX secretion system PorP/SprF family membrane protein